MLDNPAQRGLQSLFIGGALLPVREYLEIDDVGARGNAQFFRRTRRGNTGHMRAVIADSYTAAQGREVHALNDSVRNVIAIQVGPEKRMILVQPGVDDDERIAGTIDALKTRVQAERIGIDLFERIAS